LINKAFGKGFSQYNRFSALSERFRKFKERQKAFTYVIKGLARLLVMPDFAKKQANELGYVYFQDFIPNNDFDLRIIVIGDKAFGLKRMVRENDFRASGSGSILFERESIDEQCVKLAFEINEKINAQTVAYDFVYDIDGKPLVVEISYGFSVEPYDPCPGYWSKDLRWHEASFIPQEWMVDEVLKLC